MKNLFLFFVRPIYHFFVSLFTQVRMFTYGLVLKKLGKKTKISFGSQITFPWNVEIGDNFFMNRNGFVDGIGGVKIGDNVMFGPNVTILSSSHSYDSINSPMIGKEIILKNVEIGNDVWIGVNAVVMAGVKIGSGSVIGANSVVTKNIEPYTINCGVPAKKLKNRV